MPRAPIFIGSSSENERATRIGGLRIAIGSLMLLTPGLARRVFGVPAAQDNGSVRLLSRLFGVRNIILGLWTMRALEQGPDERRVCYQLNAAVDGVDVAALAWGGVSGKGLVQAAVMGGALGTTALLAWLDLLGDLESEVPEAVSLS